MATRLVAPRVARWVGLKDSKRDAPRVARWVGLKDSKRDAPRDMEAAWITGSTMGDVPSYQSSPSGVKFSCRSNTMPPTSLQAGGAIFGTRASHRERPRTQNDDAGLLVAVKNVSPGRS